MNLLRSFLFLSISFIAFSAIAEDDKPEQKDSDPVTLAEVLNTKKYIEDTIIPKGKLDTSEKLREELRRQGFEGYGMNLQVYQVLCQPELKHGFEALYTCQFKAVLREKVYNTDFNFCDEESFYKYPKTLGLLSSSSVEVTTNSPSGALDGNKTTITKTVTNNSNRLTRKDVQILRENFFGGCMREKGWYNPHNWKEGRIY